MSIGIFESIKDWLLVLSECNRILKPRDKELCIFPQFDAALVELKYRLTMA
jgi:hypothetical protein